MILIVYYILFNFMFNSGNGASVIYKIDTGPAKDDVEVTPSYIVGPDGTGINNHIAINPLFTIHGRDHYKGLIDSNNGKVITITDGGIPGNPKLVWFLDSPAGTEEQDPAKLIKTLISW